MQQQTLHKMGKESPAYLDPQISMKTNLYTSRQEIVAYFSQAMKHYREKEMLVILFNTWDQVWYYDSSRPTDPITGERLTCDWTDVMAILNE
jgi:hypothetical protein